MAEILTEQQRMAVVDRGGKLLVSAAAGSGKTKVLVDRLLGYILDPVNPANIDEFLIITYTKAAAAELRSKIASKLTERIAQQPDNRHLQQQIQRLNLTKISTVHSFCADILREHAYLLDIPSDFRVADENECAELQIRVLQKLLENAYGNKAESAEFFAFVDSQGFGRDDRKIPEIILSVYRSAYCHLNPNGWLDRCADVYERDCDDAGKTIWGEFLVRDLHRYLDLQIETLSECIAKARIVDHMEKPAALLEETLDQLRALRACVSWDQIVAHKNIDYGTLRFSNKCTDLELVDQIKAVRNACKDGLQKKLSKFSDTSSHIIGDYQNTCLAAKGLIYLVKEFAKTYGKLKETRGVLDFADLEHRTLDLLLGKSRSGATKVAGEIGTCFREVMVDEYQDSNAVQDAIFGALTEKRQNCFMVGDVKQSIYQFRLADPSIFIEKYNRFAPANEAKDGEGRKIVLSSNFRSCGSVISAVNDVFSTCMSAEVGGLEYGPEEQLNEGIPHIPATEPEIELYGLEVQSDTYGEEAEFVAHRISQLLDGTHMVRQGDTFRPIVPEDIVILLRSPGSVGWQYQYALERRGIRCASGSGEDLLQTEEIQVLVSILQTINNPLQDIPLLSVLLSRVFGFSADELAEIRAKCKYDTVYAALKVSDNEKAIHTLNVITELRTAARMHNLSSLLMTIFAKTRIDSIYAALPDGDAKVENLQNFSQMASTFEANGMEGLSKFLSYLQLLSQKGVSVQTEPGTSGAVTIMSIHKSKGLEFPVVFLCGLAKQFNQDSMRAQVLCDKELGLGLSCVDAEKRIQYPTIAKNAIIAKMKTEAISEEMRVLYVAMTRAKDRLVMVHSAYKVREEIETLAMRMKLSNPILLSSTADCHGRWVLMTAINKGWDIQFVTAPDTVDAVCEQMDSDSDIPYETTIDIKRKLSFIYPYKTATITPSKQTATQLKGRQKDSESAENAISVHDKYRSWRKPSFSGDTIDATDRGNAVHLVMQHIALDRCDDVEDIKQEVVRIKDAGLLTDEQYRSVDIQQIASFFKTDLGAALRTAKDVLREYKFSVLVNAPECNSNMLEDMVLLQGVVDCAWLDGDGITVIDFKTDRINAESVETVAEYYRDQVKIYAKALEKIFKLPVKTAQLYFFQMNSFVKVI